MTKYSWPIISTVVFFAVTASSQAQPRIIRGFDEDVEIIIGVPPAPAPAATPGPTGDAEEQPAGDAEEQEDYGKFTGEIDVRLADGGTVKLSIKPQSFTFVTPYGKLSIPAEEIRLLELSPRVPDEVAKQIEEGVANLGSPQFEIRDKAAADLAKIGPLGYSLLVQAAKANKDLEVATRLSDILDQVRAKLPDDQADLRQWDVIHTGQSRITGRLDLKTLAAESPQFGKVELKLTDVRDLHFRGGYTEVDLSKLEVAPANMYDKATQIGKTFTYRVKGNARGGSLYGTDTYTLDSNLSMAAVHAGVVKDGQEGVLRVKIIESPEAFVSSTRHGITSSAWTRYPAAYRILKR